MLLQRPSAAPSTPRARACAQRARSRAGLALVTPSLVAFALVAFALLLAAPAAVYAQADGDAAGGDAAAADSAQAATADSAATAEAEANLTDIQAIISNPGQYSNDIHEVKGSVTRIIDVAPSEMTTYILRSESGAEIRVKTREPKPEVNTTYRVRGLVQVEGFTRDATLTERNRTLVAAPGAPAPEETTAEAEGGGGGMPTWALLLLVVGGVVVVGFIGYYVLQGQQSSQPATVQGGDGRAGSGMGIEADATAVGGRSGGPSSGEIPGMRSESSSSLTSSGPATLRLKAPPKTMKFIPGKLVVSAGPDQGTEFRIAGHPAEEGNVVTIGRAKVEGERAFAHIQLGETYRTVSRIQAEIVQKDDGEVLLRNKSTTNPTLVNNEILPAEETVKLSDGDLIQMGELVMRYEV